MCRVRVLARWEEPNTGKLRPRKQTLETSCEWEGWRHGNMCLLDRSWQTSPRTWSEEWPVWASWTSVCWLNGSTDADLKWDTTLHPSLELWITGCRNRTLSWGGPSRWPPSLREYLIIVPLPKPARDPPGGIHLIELMRRRTELDSVASLSTVCRIRKDTSGSSFHTAK